MLGAVGEIRTRVALVESQTSYPLDDYSIFGVPSGDRTHFPRLRVWNPNRIDDRDKLATYKGFEPLTN